MCCPDQTSLVQRRDVEEHYQIRVHELVFPRALQGWQKLMLPQHLPNKNPSISAHMADPPSRLDNAW